MAVDLRVSELTHLVELRVRLGALRWRLRIAAALFRLGARIAGVSIIIEEG